MAKSAGQKLKIMYIADILRNETDEEHPITTKELIEKLDAMGISAERKSIYDDISQLIDYGMDIVILEGRPGGYYLASREFELAELKLLVDTVQASRFITQKKSRELITKLETLTNKANAKRLQRDVYVADRNKTENEGIYYAVDMLHEAINMNKQISFHYFEWNTKKEQVLRRDGKVYTVSPWFMTWENENYYLIAFDEESDDMKHYRVDKMLHLSIVERKRMGRWKAEKYDIAAYSKHVFGMYAGDETTVNLVCENSLAGVCIDRLGRDVAMRAEDETHIRVRTNVSVSPQFFAWVSGFGGKMVIATPENVREDYIQWTKDILNAYNTNK